MEDNIEFQPEKRDPELDDPVAKSPDPQGDPDSGTSDQKIFDFSSDLNISVVKENSEKAAGGPTNPFKSGGMPFITVIPQKVKAVAQTSHTIPKPSADTAPANTTAPKPPTTVSTPPAKPVSSAPATTPEPKPQTVPARIDPFREPIGKETSWPFASPQTLAQRKTPLAGSPNLIAEKPPSRVVPGELEPMLEKKLPTADVTVVDQTPVPKPLPPTPVPEHMPKSPQEAHKASSILKNLRTYEGDIAEVLAGRGTTSVSAALAESKRKGQGETLRNKPEEKPASKPSPKNIINTTEEKKPSDLGKKIIIVLICIILIGIGSIAGYYLYERSPLVTSQTPPTTNKQKPTTSVMSSDTQVVVPTDGLNNQTILNKIRTEVAKPQSPGSIREIVLTETREGAGYRVSAAEIVGISGLLVPDIIARTLTPQWMLGSYATPSGEQSIFVIFTTNLFQNAFAGMLTWEDDLPLRYHALFATSTSYTPAPIGNFGDGIIKNKDIRIFMSEGKPLFEYSFVDNSTLVFAANDAVMTALINRLESRAFVR